MMARDGWKRLILLAGALLSAGAAQELRQGSFGDSRRGIIFALLMILSAGILLGLLLLSLAPKRPAALDKLAALAERPGAWLGRRQGLIWLGLGLASLGLPLAVLNGPLTQVFAGELARLWLIWLVALAGAGLLGLARPQNSWVESFLGVLLLQGVVLLAAGQAAALSDSVFSLGWSEGSRYYNASQFFGPLVYGRTLPLPTLHPTRYFLQGLAFLVPGSGIAFHRLWQSLLWLACSGLAAWALGRRIQRINFAASLERAAGMDEGLPQQDPGPGWAGQGLRFWLLCAWAFTFFFVGPIYYHLILCAVPVLLWFDRRRFWRSLGVVLVGSVWAGLSRINWFPVPGALAALLYLFEEVQGRRPFWRYLLQPAAWAGAGTAAAYAASKIYIAFSGSPAEVFGSALSSPLLWYRLWPNATYGPGIVQSAAEAFLPALLLLLACLLPGLRGWNWVRLLGLAGGLGAFLAAGLVVSTKIGGGGDLHNLDNFVLFLAVALAYAASGAFRPDRPQDSAARLRPGWLVGVLGGWVVVLAVANAAVDLQPAAHTPLAADRAAEVTGGLQELLDRYDGQGPVLFITQRQMLSFHTLRVGSFEAEYEKVFLMEMAMAGNQAYLERFERELAGHKFALIVTEPLNAAIQDQHSPFAEENNAWVERVEYPILANYKLIESYQDAQIDVYAPK